MQGRDLAAALVLGALAAGAAAVVAARGDVYLPRHPAAHDLPWSRAPGAAAFAGEPVNRVFSDKINLLYPDHVFLHESLNEGRIPLWNPWILGGVSQAANPLAGVFYPPNWLLAALPVVHGPVAAAALHVLLGGLFFLLFLRRAGLGTAAALFGALAWSWSGWTAAHLQNTPLVAVLSWAPLGFASIEARARGGGRGWLAALALAMALMWLAGFPQLAVYGSAALAIHAAVAVLARARRDGARPALREAGLLLAAAAAGLLLAAPQLGATAGGLPLTGHQGATAEALVDERFRLPAFAGAVLPTVIGDPEDLGDWRAAWGARVVLGEGEEMLAPKSMNWSERTIFPGILVLVLACGAFPALRSRTGIALALVAAAGVALAAAPPVIEALARIPAFGFGMPGRAVCLLALALPALAAYALDRSLRTESAGGRRLLRNAALGGVGLLALVTGLAFAAETTWVELLVRGLRAAGLEERFGVRDPRPLAEYVEAFRPLARALRLDLLRLTLVTGAAAAAWWGLRRKPGLRVAALITILAIDLAAFLVPANRPVTSEALFADTPGLAFLRAHLGDARFLRVSRDDEAARADVDRLLVPNLGSLFGLRDAQGYREQVPRAYPALWAGTATEVRSFGIAGIAAARADAPLLDLLRVKYLVASEPIEALAPRIAFPAGGAGPADLWIYENPGALPRAWVARDWRRSDADGIRTALRDGGVDPLATVLFDAGGPGPAAAPPAGNPEVPADASVEVLAESDERLVFRVRTSSPGLLVIPDAWDPGWTAEVTRGGSTSATPVLPAFTCLRTVEIAAGDQTVTLTYRPPGVVIGTWCAAGGALLILLLPALPFRRTREPAARSRAPAQPAAPEADGRTRP